VVIVANHVSYIDPLLLGIGVNRYGRMVRFLAKRELFDHWLTGPVMRGAEQILVDRRGDAGAALRHAEQAMAEGKLLMIFPEGTIHPSLDLTKGKTGAARLALACNVPLIPAVAWGGQQVATKGQSKRLGLFTTHVVRFGPPLPYAPTDSVEDLHRRIMESLADLLEEAAAEHPVDLGTPVIRR
jgi:1-acyl-sn-glycerol-3-phosphate acyltransferase